MFTLILPQQFHASGYILFPLPAVFTFVPSFPADQELQLLASACEAVGHNGLHLELLALFGVEHCLLHGACTPLMWLQQRDVEHVMQAPGWR